MCTLNVTQRTEDLLITQEEQNRKTGVREKYKETQIQWVIANERHFPPIFSQPWGNLDNDGCDGNSNRWNSYSTDMYSCTLPAVKQPMRGHPCSLCVPNCLVSAPPLFTEGSKHSRPSATLWSSAQKKLSSATTLPLPLIQPGADRNPL